MSHKLHQWQPDAALGVPVFGCASVAFPLHLGWTGASLASFGIYLATTVVLFSAVDALARPRANRLPQPSQSLLWLLAIAAPACLAFGIGALLGPIDESFDDGFCASRGALEDDTAAAEGNDTFDVMPDCRLAPSRL